MIALAAALALLAAAPIQTAPAPGPAPQTAGQDDPANATRLSDVLVTGRPLTQMINEFVEQVSAPNHRRGLARWREAVCVSVVNLRPESAHYMVDRISARAQELGLRPGEPGCQPNIVVVATVNANDLTREFVATRPRLFRVGGSGMDRGGTAFADFLTNDRPVRWWSISVPAQRDTGQIATRLPGDMDGDGTSVMNYAPQVHVFSASRLRTEIVDDMLRSFVIIDMDKVGEVNFQQLADYVAMVSLAQVDPAADTSGYATILNVFDDPQSAPELTDWDKAYLEGLYDAERTLSDHASYLRQVASSIERAHARSTPEEDGE